MLNTLQSATGAFRLLISGGDSSSTWVLFHALDHNIGKEH